MITFKIFLMLEYTKSEIDKMRAEKTAQKNLTKTLTTLMNKQKEKPKTAWVAQIYTSYGGGAILAYSFARNYSEAEKEIKSLPYFVKFAKLPRKEKLYF